MSAPVAIDPAKCKGCSKCVRECPFGAMRMNGRIAEVDGAACRACSACVKACPFGAISEVKARRWGAADLSAYSGVWVFAEQSGGKIREVSYELLAKGRELADSRGCRLGAVLLGSGLPPEAAQSLVAHGADEVYVADDPALAEFETNAYADAVAQLIAKYRPEAVLAGATAIGRSFLPKVAVRSGAGLTADCTALEMAAPAGGGAKILHQTRPAFGGNIMATIFTPDHRPQMATVRPRVFRAAPPDASRTGKIVAEALAALSPAFKTVKRKASGENVDIAAAEILVVGGRGLKKAENFALLEKLASKLGGTVAASRAAVDAGWIPASRQVGQTGKTVAPRLYLSFGVSGAIQHLAGMRGSDFVVAVNSDPNAPIFQAADVAVTGDLFAVAPALLKALDERMA